VIGSIVGVQKYVYDIFGPGVNLAARMEALSEPMKITISEEHLQADQGRLHLQRAGRVRGQRLRHAEAIFPGSRWPNSTSGASKGMAPRSWATCFTWLLGTKRNSASESMKRLMSQGQATRSTWT
jgi:hypothetical protein